MNDSYTIYNQNSTFDYTSFDDIEDAVDYLKNPDSFRTFDKGLTELLMEKEYSGKTDGIEELSEYLISKLRKINSSVKKETVVSWFSGKHRPKIEASSRNEIYEICFALELSYEETLWFFHHVYYDRAFNCRTIDEAVYYYAFRNHLSYPEAQALINEIADTPASSEDFDIPENYTQFIRKSIEELESVTELKTFLIRSRTNFGTWNKTAFDELIKLKSILIGSPENTAVIDRLKRTIRQKQISSQKPDSKVNIQSLNLFTLADYPNCGLLIKEILYEAMDTTTYDSPVEHFLDAVNKKNIRANDFILERILSISAGMQKVKNIPYIVRNNFPSKKTMSDILSEDKISKSKSYDSIRKMIILLDFYCFWVEVKLGIGDTKEYSGDMLPDIYIMQIKLRLQKCGYEKLYAGNPYDWIFLCSAQSEDPLEYFRNCIDEILSDNF